MSFTSAEERVFRARRQQLDLLLRGQRGKRGTEAGAGIGVERLHSAAEAVSASCGLAARRRSICGGHARVRRARSIGARNDGIDQRLQALEFRWGEECRLGFGG